MAKKKAKRKVSTKTKAKGLVKKAKNGVKREGKKAKRGAKKIGRKVKKVAKRVGKKTKKFVKTDTGRATIGAGAGALLLGPIGAVAGAAAGLATRKGNPMSLSPRASIVREIFQLEQSVRHSDPKLASRLRKKHQVAFDYLERRAKVGETIRRTHPMYMPIVELHSELSRRGNPERTVKIASVVGSLMLDYHKASPTIEHVAASALRGERVELAKVKTARTKLKSLIRMQKIAVEREQLEDLVDALDRIISKAEGKTIPRGRNPGGALSLEAQVKSTRRSKAKKAATSIASRSKVYGEVKRKSTAAKLRKINPDHPSTLDDLTDKYRRTRKRWLSVSTKTSSTAGEISRSRKRMDDAENKLVLFAEIRNMSPEDLRRYMKHAQQMQSKAKRRAGGGKRSPNPHHKSGSKTSEEIDPYANYMEGIITDPDEIIETSAKTSWGQKYHVLAVRVGNRWANVHRIRSGDFGQKRAGYGVRFWMEPHQLEEAGISKAKKNPTAKAKKVRKRTLNPSVSIHEQKAQRYFTLALDKLKRARKSGNVSSWLSTLSTATRANVEFENAGAPERYALAAFDIQSEAMSAIEQKCIASPRIRASLNPPRGIKLLHIPPRAKKEKIRATIGRNIAKLTESKDPRTKRKYPQQQAIAIALTQAREDATKRPALKRELTRLYGKAPNPHHTRPEKPRKKKRKTSRPTRPYRRKRSGGGKR